MSTSSLTHKEIDAVLLPLLERCDTGGRLYVAGVAITAAQENEAVREALHQAIERGRMIAAAMD